MNSFKVQQQAAGTVKTSMKNRGKYETTEITEEFSGRLLLSFFKKQDVKAEILSNNKPNFHAHSGHQEA